VTHANVPARAKRELKAGGVVADHSIAHTCDLVSTCPPAALSHSP